MSIELNPLPRYASVPYLLEWLHHSREAVQRGKGCLCVCSLPKKSFECIYMVFYTKLAKSLYMTFEKKYIDIKITENVLNISICKLFVTFDHVCATKSILFTLLWGTTTLKMKALITVFLIHCFNMLKWY